MYRSSAPLPQITRPTHLLPSAHDPIIQKKGISKLLSLMREKWPHILIKAPHLQTLEERSVAGAGSENRSPSTEGDSEVNNPKAPRSESWKGKAHHP